MASNAEKDAVLAYGATARSTVDATGKIGLAWRLAALATGQSFTIPTALRGAWVEMTARGTVVQYGTVKTGDTAPTLTLDTIVVPGTGAAAAGSSILEDTSVQVLFPADHDRLVWVCTTASAGQFFEGRLAGPLKGR